MSRLLYDVMDRIGASEEMRKLHQTAGITKTISHTMLHYLSNNSKSRFIFGSYCEGTTTPRLQSDIDILHCDDSVPVIEDIRDAPTGVSLLIVRDRHTRPGYVKLQEVYNGIPLTKTNSGRDKLKNSLYDNAKRMVRKHVFSGLEFIQTRNGPAETDDHPVMSTDYVAAYQCKTIPTFAREWIYRRRLYDWPSTYLIDKMSKMGCFFVGVGHPSSDEYEVEWRLSLSLQDREIMFNFNPVQHKCYILLKMIKKDFIETHAKKCISSYHCKTCMFYVIENTRKEMWTPDNLFKCVMLCLGVLLKWVFDGKCPNYFTKEENMFNKGKHIHHKEVLLFLFSTLIFNGDQCLFRLTCDDIGYLMNERKEQTINATECIAIEHKFKLKIRIIMDELYFRTKINALLPDNRSAMLNLKLLSILNKETIIKTPTNRRNQIEDLTKERVSFLISCVHSRFAALAINVCSTQVNHCQELIIHQYPFRQCGNGDLTSSRLEQASKLYIDSQYETCAGILEKIEHDIHPYVLSLCNCYKKNVLDFDEFYVRSRNKFHSESVSQIMSNAATCVMFLPSDKSNTPTPLHYEMYRAVDITAENNNDLIPDWFKWAVIDGKIYLYLLRYIVYAKLNNHIQNPVAIAQLKWVIENDLNLGHRETAYNLLGWMYVHENCVQEGFECFMKSWHIRPHYNAAKWHLWALVSKLLGNSLNAKPQKQ